jgi:hypothetical protein
MIFGLGEYDQCVYLVEAELRTTTWLYFAVSVVIAEGPYQFVV